MKGLGFRVNWGSGLAYGLAALGSVGCGAFARGVYNNQCRSAHDIGILRERIFTGTRLTLVLLLVVVLCKLATSQHSGEP